jgi:tripartite-type tricarboxylate transporter receptor subunit TctC
MKTAISAFALAALAGGSALGTGQAWAQDYPNRPITVVIPTTSGTAADIAARTLAPRLGQILGKPLVVENRTGASGNIGVASVVKAPPDGHTILLTASTLSVSPVMFKDLGWDPVKDLQPVARMASITYVLLVHPSVQAANVRELIALAKQKPGQLNFGSPGTGTPHHLIMEQFKQAAGINITHIPYKGTAQAMTDLMGGRVETAFFPVHTSAQLAKAGKLRMVASVGEKRTPWTPELPTLNEQGVSGVDADVWIGMFAPRGTPPAIYNRLSQEVLALLGQPDIRETLFQQGIVVNATGPDELAAYLKNDIERYRRIVTQGKITAD